MIRDKMREVLEEADQDSFCFSPRDLAEAVLQEFDVRFKEDL